MHTLRLLARTPLFALTAIASLAIGIGANTAIFTAANALLFAPTAGVREMDRLVDIGRTTEGRGFDTVSYATYADLRDRIRAAESPFEGVYATRFEPVPLAFGTNDGAERIYGEQVSPSYFEVLGVQPAAGVAFLAGEEDVATPLRKVVLTHAFWQSHFGGRADAVGQSITLNGDSFTVVGVAARGFTGATVLSSDLWIPSTAMSRGLASPETLRGRRNNSLIMVGRLKPGASIAQAQAFLDAFIADLQRQHTEVYARIGLRATPASRVPGVGSEFVAPFLAVLMGVAGLVLLVTCTNLAGLLLARAAGRSREVAVRLALGASRRALVAMLMTEAFALSAFGALAAVALGWSLTRVMSAALTGLPVPITVDLALDWRVLAFTACVALVTTCVTGLAPALQSSKADLVSDLKSDASAPRRQRLRHIFISAQLAFCLVLIVVAGLFLRALGTATHVDPGMDVSRVEVVSLDLTFGDYPEASRPEVGRIPARAARRHAGRGAGGPRPHGAARWRRPRPRRTAKARNHRPREQHRHGLERGIARLLRHDGYSAGGRPVVRASRSTECAARGHHQRSARACAVSGRPGAWPATRERGFPSRPGIDNHDPDDRRHRARYEIPLARRAARAVHLRPVRPAADSGTERLSASR